MQEYISKQVQILRPAEQIYTVISRFDHLTPALAGRVDEWQATEDTCSFKVKGFQVKLRMEERIEPKHVKITGDGVPMDFAFWVQLHKVDETDTRLRLVLHAELNMMMKMLIGSKLQQALDQIADGIAGAMR
ncbi:MAG: SRPBCC family protein [Alistipes sp.]|nr:SRPBCC family protein [Alistipes sp.]